MQNSKKLTGILKDVSIVTKNLVEKLMLIDRDIMEFESSQAEMSGK